MNLKINVASLLAFPTDQHLSTLNEELRQIRTEAIEHANSVEAGWHWLPVLPVKNP